MFRNSSWQGVCLALSFVFASSQAAQADEAEQGLSQERLIDAGREQFTRVRQHTKIQADATHDAERFFNAQSCAECHKLGGIGGAGPNENNVQLLNTVGRPEQIERIVRRNGRYIIERPNTTASVNGGDAVDKLRAASVRFVPIGSEGITILHRRSTVPGYAEWRLDEIHKADPRNPEVVARKVAEDALRIRCICGSYAPAPDPFEERNTPPLFGLGLIASIPQAEIDAIAASQHEDIRGRAPRLRTGGIGRFGWKSQTATLADFNEGACAAELGLKTAKFTPSERITFRSRAPGVKPMAVQKAKPVDMTADDLAALTMYVASLPMPRQVAAAGHERDVADGALVFRAIGCATCHVRDVGAAAGIYSDLLLHSVGTSGSAAYYGSPIGPTPTEFDIVQSTEIRTPPLWGVADSGPYLHDGSAATLEAAILKHTDQADKSAQLYKNQLSDEQRTTLLTFLGSLRAPPPDVTANR